MLQWLAQFLTAPIINGFLNAYKAKLAAANAQGAQNDAAIGGLEQTRSTLAKPAKLFTSRKVSSPHSCWMQPSVGFTPPWFAHSWLCVCDPHWQLPLLQTAQVKFGGDGRIAGTS